MSLSPHLGTSVSRHILITGGCGFIGANLIAHLIKETPDIKIKILDNLSVGTKEDLSAVRNVIGTNLSIHNSDFSNQVELKEGDIRDLDTCLKCCEGVDFVVHLAANAGVD